MLLLNALFITIASGLTSHPADTIKPHTAGTIKSHPTNAIKTLETDDFPVPDKLFGRDVNQNARKIISGGIESSDKVWFINDSLHQSLVVELYTDNFRDEIFLFQNENIPKGLINEMELINADHELADSKQKQKYFRGFIKKARKINARYFASNKGMKIGMPKDEALKFYGRPDKITRSAGGTLHHDPAPDQADSTEMYKWEYKGDVESSEEQKKSKGKPLARDSYGYEVTMYFRGGKLIGLILHNIIP